MPVAAADCRNRILYASFPAIIARFAPARSFCPSQPACGREIVARADLRPVVVRQPNMFSTLPLFAPGTGELTPIGAFWTLAAAGACAAAGV